MPFCSAKRPSRAALRRASPFHAHSPDPIPLPSHFSTMPFFRRTTGHSLPDALDSSHHMNWTPFTDLAVVPVLVGPLQVLIALRF